MYMCMCMCILYMCVCICVCVCVYLCVGVMYLYLYMGIFGKGYLFKGCIRRRLMPKCYAKYGFSIGIWDGDGLFICLFIYFSLFLYTFCYIYKLNIYI